jgi:hypothetical protein
MWIYYFRGPSSIIDWERIQEQKVIETTAHSFRLGPFILNVPAESYVIFEYFNGSEIQHNLIATYIFLGVMFLCITVLLTVITTLQRIWYFAGMSLFIVFIITLRFDVLLLFGQRGLLIPIAIAVVYTALSFYFKYMRPYFSFTARLVSFLFVGITIFLMILFFSKVSYPFMHFLITGYTPALVLTILFIITVAHEIVASFVFITNQGSTSNAAKHFTFISLIYIAYVMITSLKHMGVIDWNFLYVNVYLLLTISGLLGIWGFKLREPQYDQVFTFYPFGAFYYLTLGSIAFIFTAQLLGNANDATLRVIEDVIIFTHTGFGIIFLTYFIANFMSIMGSNIPVHRIIYKPTRMPFFTFRFAGIIASLVFIFYSNWRGYVYDSTGGFYNYVGDLYLLQDDELYGMTFYDQSRSRAFQNNRANYALGTLRTARLDLDKAQNNYELSNGKRPTEFSLVNEGNLKLYIGDFFGAIEKFQYAAKVLPASDVIKNNLGYSYSKIHSVDSASSFLNQARENDFTKSAAEANFFAMSALEYIPIEADSIRKFFNSDSRAVEANALATATLFRQKLKSDQDPIPSGPLDLYTATYLNNYIVHNIKDLDSAFISRAYKVASDSANIGFRESLKAALAIAYYHQHKVYKALAILGELVYLTQSFQGNFNYTVGLWSLEQGNPEMAASFFNYAESSNYKEGKFYRAIALTENGQLREALEAWNALQNSEDDEVKLLAQRIIRILQASLNEALSMPDAEKYQFVRYRLSLRDTTVFSRLVNSFTNDNYKAQSLLDFARKFYKADRITTAIRYLNQTTGLKLTNEKLFNDIRYLELLMLSSRSELQLLAKQINKGVTFDKEHELYKLLFAAQMSELSGDLETARKNYEFLAHANPYFEEGILAATTFFRNQDTKSLKPYEILTEAIYVNTKSIRLLKAYAGEASRQGFDQYASSAAQRIMEAEEQAFQ